MCTFNECASARQMCLSFSGPWYAQFMQSHWYSNHWRQQHEWAKYKFNINYGTKCIINCLYTALNQRIYKMIASWKKAMFSFTLPALPGATCVPALIKWQPVHIVTHYKYGNKHTIHPIKWKKCFLVQLDLHFDCKCHQCICSKRRHYLTWCVHYSCFPSKLYGIDAVERFVNKSLQLLWNNTKTMNRFEH